MKTGRLKSISLLLVVLMLAGITGGCSPKTPNEESDNLGNIARAADYSTYYQEFPVNEQPCLQPYQVAADLSNVENSQRFEFNPDAQKFLVENGFVVLPEPGVEFFLAYELNRYSNTPNLITTDAMLHNYHLFFQHLLKTVEQEKLIPELKKLNSGMVQASQKQWQALKNTPWENAALRNIAFFAVGTKLSDPTFEIPIQVKAEVQAELDLIKAQQDTAVSPVMNLGSDSDIVEALKEDYTQYIPRGHYTHSEALKEYFQTMMWYGRLTFRLKDEDETRSAVLITLALAEKDTLLAWDKIYQTTDFFVGESDDPGFDQFDAVLKNVYGNNLSLREISGDEEKWQYFLEKAHKIKGPSINSIPLFDDNINPDREQEISGFRFMGQRYTVDADIFQRLIYREVGEDTNGQRRMLPKGLDIPAALGSEEAGNILKDSGDFDYQNYSENMEKMQQQLRDLPENSWHQNLYWSWMNALRPLTQIIPEGYPSFMQSQAWARKELNTFLSSWTELKHDTLLYSKQNYAEMGGGGDENIDDRGYVEPNPHLYARLASLAAMTRDGLNARGLLNERDADSLKRMEQLALELKAISEKELRGESLTEAEYELIRSFGGQLEHFWMEALRDQSQEGGRSYLLTNNPAMLTADVATAPPDTVLQEAIGFVNAIYAVVPVEGKLRIAKGAVFSYYEFPWPAQDRLTDEKWREMVMNRQTPEPPAWTSLFQVQTGDCREIMPWEAQ